MRSVLNGLRCAVRVMWIVTCSVALVWTCLAQSPAKLEFEVASVKPAPPRGSVGCHGGPGTDDPGRLTCGGMSAGLLIMIAYGVKYVQVVGPDWLSTARFEISASLPENTTRAQLAVMWQNLLAERFHLVVHREPREMAHFDLVVAKNGPKLTAARTSTGSGSPPVGGIGRRADGNMHMEMPRLTMEAFATMLGNQLHQLVTDATGLTGEYEIQLQWAPDTAATASAESAPALPQALQEQLGLRLETKKDPVDMLVIDHIDRAPTEN